MINNQDYIRLLMIEKLTGAICYEDKIYLDERIKQDRQVELYWIDMQTKWIMLQGDSKLKKLNLEDELQAFKGYASSEVKTVLMPAMICVAAIIILMLFADT